MYIQDANGNFLNREGEQIYRRVQIANQTGVDRAGNPIYEYSEGYREVTGGRMQGPTVNINGKEYAEASSYDLSVDQLENAVFYGNRTEHQTLGDRITGTRETWNNEASERSDNRWDPNSTKDRANEGISGSGREQVEFYNPGQGQNNTMGGQSGGNNP